MKKILSMALAALLCLALALPVAGLADDGLTFSIDGTKVHLKSGYRDGNISVAVSTSVPGGITFIPSAITCTGVDGITWTPAGIVTVVSGRSSLITMNIPRGLSRGSYKVTATTGDDDFTFTIVVGSKTTNNKRPATYVSPDGTFIAAPPNSGPYNWGIHGGWYK